MRVVKGRSLQSEKVSNYLDVFTQDNQVLNLH